MNVNFGLFPDVMGALRGRDRKKALSARALHDLQHWLGTEVHHKAHGEHKEY
jgi:methylenetetrahydrofolate--tRNA-(uracil-5-)-methyltransferase